MQWHQIDPEIFAEDTRLYLEDFLYPDQKYLEYCHEKMSLRAKIYHRGGPYLKEPVSQIFNTAEGSFAALQLMGVLMACFLRDEAPVGQPDDPCHKLLRQYPQNCIIRRHSIDLKNFLFATPGDFIETEFKIVSHKMIAREGRWVFRLEGTIGDQENQVHHATMFLEDTDPHFEDKH